MSTALLDLDPQLMAHPREKLDKLREHCPIARIGEREWAVLGYDEIVSISRCTKTFSSREACERPDAVMRETLPRNEPRVLYLEIET